MKPWEQSQKLPLHSPLLPAAMVKFSSNPLLKRPGHFSLERDVWGQGGLQQCAAIKAQMAGEGINRRIIYCSWQCKWDTRWINEGVDLNKPKEVTIRVIRWELIATGYLDGKGINRFESLLHKFEGVRLIKHDKQKCNYLCQREDEERMGIYYFSAFYLVSNSSGCVCFWVTRQQISNKHT